MSRASFLATISETAIKQILPLTTTIKMFATAYTSPNCCFDGLGGLRAPLRSDTAVYCSVSDFATDFHVM